MKTRIFAILLPVLVSLCLCCRERNSDKISEKEVRETEKALVGVNRLMVKKDHDKIASYARRNHLDMKETDTGLWYHLDGTKECEKAKKGQLATIKYEVSLTDGTICYSSDSLGLKKFRIGRGGVESGLEEGILMMCPGTKALFIMPPHLAHGLTGDGDRIPARSIIIYRVELINLES